MYKYILIKKYVGLVDVELCECGAAEKKQIKKVEEERVTSDSREHGWWCWNKSKNIDISSR